MVGLGWKAVGGCCSAVGGRCCATVMMDGVGALLPSLCEGVQLPASTEGWYLTYRPSSKRLVAAWEYRAVDGVEQTAGSSHCRQRSIWCGRRGTAPPQAPVICSAAGQARAMPPSSPLGLIRPVASCVTVRLVPTLCPLGTHLGLLLPGCYDVETATRLWQHASYHSCKLPPPSTYKDDLRMSGPHRQAAPRPTQPPGRPACTP